MLTKNILIIEDDRFSRMKLEDILKSEGFNLMFAVDSARTAVHLLGLDGSNPTPIEVDLILLDIMMPEIDGVHMCSLINRTAKYKDVPIIMLTPENEEEALKKVFQAGATDYITKPTKKAELLVRVRSALRLKTEIDKRKAREAEYLQVTLLLEEIVSQLQQTSLTDGLIGMVNRRSFNGV
jgi:PleD family two-component response regulator